MTREEDVHANRTKYFSTMDAVLSDFLLFARRVDIVECVQLISTDKLHWCRAVLLDSRMLFGCAFTRWHDSKPFSMSL